MKIGFIPDSEYNNIINFVGFICYYYVMIKKGLRLVLSISLAFIISGVCLILLSKRNKIQESVNIELTYVFVDEDGQIYDIFTKNGHGSATDWSFLFQEDENENIIESNGDEIDSELLNNTGTSIKKGEQKDNEIDFHNSQTGLDSDFSERVDSDKNSNEKKGYTNLKTGVKIADKTGIQQFLSEDVREIAYELNIPECLLKTNSGVINLILSSKSIPTTGEKEQRIYSLLKMTDDQIKNLNDTLMLEKQKLELIEKKYGKGKTGDEAVLNGNLLPNIDYVGNGGVNNQTGEVEKNKNINYTYKNCVTPRNFVVQHGEYVLAYEQRKDVPDICNVQKRVCKDGRLLGTYTQGYCNETVDYKTTKVKATSYNNKSQSQLIQTPKYGKNDDSDFDKYGKINGKGDTPTTIRDNNDTENPVIVQPTRVNQNEKKYYNCTAPWGDIVTHGQFIKAYASPLGFTDDGCKVELRLCLDGELQGNYSYQKCKYTNVSYSEYKDGDKTIYDLYNEAYNLTNVADSDVKNIYEDLGKIYNEAENIHSLNSYSGDDTIIDNIIDDIIQSDENGDDENSNDVNFLSTPKLFIKHMRDWLVSLF